MKRQVLTIRYMFVHLSVYIYLLQAFSSDSSLQSGLSLQNSSFSIHSPLPHDNFPSGQMGSSVFKMGNTFLGSDNNNNSNNIYK